MEDARAQWAPDAARGQGALGTGARASSARLPRLHARPRRGPRCLPLGVASETDRAGLRRKGGAYPQEAQLRGWAGLAAGGGDRASAHPRRLLGPRGLGAHRRLEGALEASRERSGTTACRTGERT